ncbi:hypothetical protein F444_03267 [Phytophthora nicotianae P1976]|uniref:Uncharacterized protein n=1 Tax=Phytophthora nicotianae P1976 TaxID=1317066 RepID=A0A081AUQ3_PHYNI|nr:hypothetical protein F444_03267 [Phytophthora nicotianae P1976]
MENFLCPPNPPTRSFEFTAGLHERWGEGPIDRHQQHHQEKKEGEKKLIKHDLQGKVIAGDVVTGSSSSSSSRKRR